MLLWTLMRPEATVVAHASTLDAANAAASSNIETESIPAAEANADGKPSYSSRSVPADNITHEQGVTHPDVENVEAASAAQGVPMQRVPKFTQLPSTAQLTSLARNLMHLQQLTLPIVSQYDVSRLIPSILDHAHNHCI